MAVPISNVTRRQVYAPSGTGGAGPYSFTFEILANTDIAVYKDNTLLTLTTHYTVTINANGTGSVTITAAGLALSPTSPTQYAVVGNRTIARSTDFTTGGDFFANTINDELDQQTIFAQQNAEGLQRALIAPQTDPTTINMTLPAKATRASKTLTFDVDGNPSAGVSAADVANAVTYATNAANSATAAASSASSASSSASAASSSASTASTQASNASTSASNASTSASGASTSATNAAASASTASTQASNASTSATNAASSASAASTSASNAATSATSAETAKTAAESARDATLAAYDSFDDRYLGAKSSDPSVDNDGNALTAGSLYFNSVDNVMKLWTGSAWVAAYVSGSGFMDLSSSQTAAGTKTFSSNPILSGGTANGVAYLNGSKVLTTGSALVFDGTNLSTTGYITATNTSNTTVAAAGFDASTSWSLKVANASTTAGTGAGIFFLGGTNSESWIGNLYESSGVGALSFQTRVSGTRAERMRIDSSGNLGVGTTSPSYRLHAVSSASVVSRLGSSGGSGAFINFIDSGASPSVAPSVGAIGNSLVFMGDGSSSERMRIDSSGNLLVGTTAGSSTERFSVLSANTSNNRVTQQIYNTAATSTTRLDNRLTRIASNGSGADVNIQFTDSVAHNYFFGGNNGGAYVVANSNGVRLSNGGTSWASDSDERLKDIIEPITDAVVKVSTLRAVIGKYKTDEDGKRRAFLIAQDVQAVLPEAVFDEQGTLMLAYTETIPLLVAAIQEQQALITQLTARITALESA